MATLRPRARAAAYSPSPGMPTTAASPSAEPRSRPGRVVSRPMRRVARRPWLGEQEERERDGDQGEADAQDLVDQVQPRAVGLRTG